MPGPEVDSGGRRQSAARGLRDERRIGTDDGAQQRRDLRRLGIAQVDDVDVARRQRRLVELRDQALGDHHPRGARGAQDQRVRARFRQHRDPLAGIDGLSRSAGAFVEHAVDDGADFHRQAELDRDDFRFRRGRRIDRLDDPLDAPQVVGVVGDDERVVLRIGRDRVVRRDQRAQDRHHRRRRFVLQAEHLRDELVAARSASLRADDRAALQLGVRFRQHPRDVSGLHDREALQAQRGQQLLVGLLARDRPLGDERQRSLDARVDHESPAGVLADGADHGVDVRVHEIQHHRLGGRGRVRRVRGGGLAGRRRCGCSRALGAGALGRGRGSQRGRCHRQRTGERDRTEQEPLASAFGTALACHVNHRNSRGLPLHRAGPAAKSGP